MVRNVEARIKDLFPGDQSKGVIVLSDQVKLNDQARQALTQLAPIDDIRTLDYALARHVSLSRGGERFIVDNTYTLNYLLLGGMLAFAVPSIDVNQVGAWLRILHRVKDELQSSGKLLLHYADKPRARVFVASGTELWRKRLSLEDSYSNLVRIMVPVLGPEGVNFKYVNPTVGLSN